MSCLNYFTRCQGRPRRYGHLRTVATDGFEHGTICRASTYRPQYVAALLAPLSITHHSDYSLNYIESLTRGRTNHFATLFSSDLELEAMTFTSELDFDGVIMN